jgi:hypothetical protein
MNLSQIVTLLATVLAAGWFSAFVVQLVKQQKWASWVKLALSAVIALLVTLATLYLSGEMTNFLTMWKSGTLTAEHVIAFFTLVFTSAAAWYKLNFKDSTWAQSLGAWPSKSE